MIKRIVSTIVAVAATAAVIFGSQTLGGSPFMLVGDKAGSTLTKVKAKELTLVCPGSVFATGGASGTNVSAFQRIGTAVADYSSNLPAGVSLKTLALTGPAASRGNATDTSNRVGNLASVNAVAITVADSAGSAVQSSALLTAQSYQVSNTRGVLGAIGANCQTPSAESWLVGASSAVGREALLVLANPTATDATVNLQIFGEQGQIEGAGLSGISVSANRTVVLPLAAFAPVQGSLAVHVTSAGAPLATWIQERTVRGTLAAGADLVSPSVPANHNLVIPGLFKRGTKDATTLISGNADYADLTPAAQVFVPGAKDATVTVQVIGTDPKSTGTVAQQQITAGSTANIPLTGLKDGNYAVFVVADQPVMAAVRLSRTNLANTPNTDFAWLSAVAPNVGPLVITSAKSAISKLSIANPGHTPVVASVTNLTDGGITRITVPQLGSAVVTVKPGTVVSVAAAKPLASTLIADFNWLLTAIPLIDYRNSGGWLSVLVR